MIFGGLWIDLLVVFLINQLILYYSHNQTELRETLSNVSFCLNLKMIQFTVI